MSTVHSVAKISSQGRSTSEDLLEGGEELVAAQAGEGERAPGDPELDAEGGLVGAVAADVADHRVDGAVGGADGVVEVPAEQGPAAAGAVAGREAEVGAFEERVGQQPALQSGVLLGAQFRFCELVLGDVGPFSLHRVADGAAQQPAVELVAEEEVLGADLDRLGGALGVVLGGEDQDGVARGEPQDLAEGGQLVGGGVGRGRAGAPEGGVRERQVQQDAVHVGREQPGGLGEVAGAAEPDAVAVGVEYFGDGEAARGVVLDHEQVERLVGGGVARRPVGGDRQNGLTALRGGGVPLPRYGYGHRFRFLPSPEGAHSPDPNGRYGQSGMAARAGASVICRYRGGNAGAWDDQAHGGDVMVPTAETCARPPRFRPGPAPLPLRTRPGSAAGPTRFRCGSAPTRSSPRLLPRPGAPRGVSPGGPRP
ncbi:hypothetical protein GCM10020254_46840 [Streptomyces goshikiensis]